jgi:hypothetical protein
MFVQYVQLVVITDFENIGSNLHATGIALATVVIDYNFRRHSSARDFPHDCRRNPTPWLTSRLSTDPGEAVDCRGIRFGDQKRGSRRGSFLEPDRGRAHARGRDVGGTRSAPYRLLAGVRPVGVSRALSVRPSAGEVGKPAGGATRLRQSRPGQTAHSLS